MTIDSRVTKKTAAEMQPMRTPTNSSADESGVAHSTAGRQHDFERAS